MIDLQTISTLRPFNDPFGIAFHIGNLDVRWYAILSIIGYAIAILTFCLIISYKYKLKYEPAFYFIFPCLPMCILGARFWSACIGDLTWDNFFKIGEGGLAIQGGVVFGLITGIIYFPLVLRLPKYHVRVEIGEKVFIQQPSFFLYADAIIPTILLGQAIGRWGNFFNGEIFGSPVALSNESNGLDWLKVLMPGVYDHMISKEGITGLNNVPNNGLNYVFQPLFLYESFLGICSFLFIYFVLTNIYKIKAGVVAGSYFVAYGLIRFIMEPLRSNQFAYLGTYVMNGILLGFGILWVVYCQWIYPRFRKNYVDKTLNLYIRYLIQKINKKSNLNENNTKIEQKIQKLNCQYNKINSKKVDTYDEKITKQFKLKNINDKINKCKGELKLSTKNKNITLKEFINESNIQIIRKEGECIYFANR